MIESRIDDLVIVHDREGDKFVAIIYKEAQRVAYGFSKISAADAEKGGLKKAANYFADNGVAHDRAMERAAGIA